MRRSLRRDHLGRRRRAADEAVQVRSCPPAEERANPAGLDRGEIRRLPARRLVTDPVDARILEEQRARAEPRPDLGQRDTGREQAPARHHAVPNSGQLGDYCLYRPILVSHGDT